MYRLNVAALRAAAADKGDTTGYAIAQRTGLAESTISRWLTGQTQPGTLSLLILCRTYETTLDALMTEVCEAA